VPWEDWGGQGGHGQSPSNKTNQYFKQKFKTTTEEENKSQQSLGMINKSQLGIEIPRRTNA
jgi:hypothetical protein